jgi:hypothetical protein
MGVLPFEQTEPYTLRDVNSVASESPELENSPSWEEFLLELGELPAVQDRFYTLLKNRLQVEIQHNPPLFPWETAMHDYEAAPAYAVANAGVEHVSLSKKKPLRQIWLNHLRTLNLPVAIPEAVLAHLLQQCQEVAQSSLREGAKLVRAVEDLFPDGSQALNQIAGIVMTSPARTGTLASSTSRTDTSVSYETATPTQQMALSLMTAWEILNSLTLTVSPNQPAVERQWQTEFGTLRLRAEYVVHQGFSNLRVTTDLPKGGSLTLNNGDLQTATQRPTAGWLSLELVDPDKEDPCTLTIQLADSDQEALVFVIRIAG